MLVSLLSRASGDVELSLGVSPTRDIEPRGVTEPEGDLDLGTCAGDTWLTLPRGELRLPRGLSHWRAY